MSKTNALYIIIVILVAVAIFLGVAVSNNSSSHSQTQVLQKSDACCAGDATQVNNKVKSWNEICPVMGGKVNPKSATVEHNEKHYGFCCPGCIDKFAGDPEKFAANLSEDGKRFLN